MFMKRSFLSIVIFFSFCLIINAQSTHTVNISGFTFSPNDLNIVIGDTVFFNGSSTHPVLEVSLNTWNDEENTAIPGGFSFPSGVGKIAFEAGGTHYYICENHISSGMKGKITVSTATKIDQINLTKEIKLYPNPLEGDYLWIERTDQQSRPLEIKIYDITGKVKIDKTLSSELNEFALNCSGLAAGMYIVQVKSGNYSSSSKLVKK